MEDWRNEGRLILVSGATGQQGEWWRGAYSNAESGYVRSPEVPRSPRRESSPSCGTSAPTAGRTLRLHRKADERTVAWSCA